MAQNVVINGVTYSSVPEVDIPKSGGGTAKFFDTASADISAADVLINKVGFGSAGAINGSMANNGALSGTIGTKAGTFVIPAGYTSGGTVALTNISDLVAGNLLSGKSVLGIDGALVMPTISQNSTTKILSIS